MKKPVKTSQSLSQYKSYYEKKAFRKLKAYKQVWVKKKRKT